MIIGACNCRFRFRAPVCSQGISALHIFLISGMPNITAKRIGSMRSQTSEQRLWIHLHQDWPIGVVCPTWFARSFCAQHINDEIHLRRSFRTVQCRKPMHREARDNLHVTLVRRPNLRGLVQHSMGSFVMFCSNLKIWPVFLKGLSNDVAHLDNPTTGPIISSLPYLGLFGISQHSTEQPNPPHLQDAKDLDSKGSVAQFSDGDILQRKGPSESCDQKAHVTWDHKEPHNMSQAINFKQLLEFVMSRPRNLKALNNPWELRGAAGSLILYTHSSKTTLETMKPWLLMSQHFQDFLVNLSVSMNSPVSFDFIIILDDEF